MFSKKNQIFLINIDILKKLLKKVLSNFSEFRYTKLMYLSMYGLKGVFMIKNLKSDNTNYTNKI